MLTINDFKVDLEIFEKQNILARADVRIPPAKIMGFLVIKSEYGDGLFVQVPSIRTKTGRYNWVFKIDDGALWHELEAKIKAIYKRKKQEHENELADVNESIDPDDLPF